MRPRTLAIRAAALGLVLAVVAACTESPEARTSPTTSPSPTAAATPGPARFPLDASITELQQAMGAGTLTSVELVDFYLARIKAYDDAGPELKAIINLNPDARNQAAALDAERARSGPRSVLHGIPLVIKDNIDSAEMPTTGGTVPLEHFRPAKDAFQVRKLRKAGAIILATTNLAELAQSWQTRSAVGGQTLNPYDTSREPGGSSGGTAVAVTANFAAGGLGTDTCGSNRLPAGLNNLYSLRPTSGLSSRAGVIPYMATLDEVGPEARTIEDLAILLDATAGKDPADPATVGRPRSFVAALDDDVRGRRLGVLPFTDDQENAGTLQRALDEMERAGVVLVRTPQPRSVDSELVGFQEEADFSMKTYLAGEPTAPTDAFSQIAHKDAAGVTRPRSKAYLHGLAARQSLRQELVKLMDRLDLDGIAYAVSPTTARPIAEAVPGDSATIHADCATAAVSGMPALVVPAGFAPDDLPVGLELLGRPFSELRLIAIAAAYEAQGDHRRLPPTTPPLVSR